MALVKHDYYEVLGVARDAGADEIRRAFYDAAGACRPDGGRWTGAERFRELSEAYDVLSRPGSRLLYDRHGYRARGNGVADGAASELVESPSPPYGEDVYEDVVLRWYESVDGTAKIIQFDAAETCPVCEGHGTAHPPEPDCPACGGSGRLRRPSAHNARKDVDTCPLCSPEPCAQCGGAGRVDTERRLRVRIPPGIESGDQLRVAGEGNAAPYGGVPGDLLLDVVVEPEPKEPRFVRYVALLLFVIAIAILVIYLR
jgi:molecular chaperone DnaJ